MALVVRLLDARSVDSARQVAVRLLFVSGMTSVSVVGAPILLAVTHLRVLKKKLAFHGAQGLVLSSAMDSIAKSLLNV